MIEKVYRNCYVAFLDILGFKNMINSSDCNIRQKYQWLKSKVICEIKKIVNTFLTVAKGTRSFKNGIYRKNILQN